MKEYRDEIPVEDRIKPHESLIGPAIDAAEHFLDNEALRIMFAQRIASCYDRRKEIHNHPSFTNIIQGLSPYDAWNLQMVHNGLGFQCSLIYQEMSTEKGDDIRVYYNHNDSYYRSTMTNIKEEYKELLDPWKVSSANSLERAGLITVEKIIKEKHKPFVIETRIYSLTDLGSAFCSICLPEPPKKEDNDAN